MTTVEINQVNATIKKLRGTGKAIVDCNKKQVFALKGQLTLSISGMVDHLKKFGMRVSFVTALPSN